MFATSNIIIILAMEHRMFAIDCEKTNLERKVLRQSVEVLQCAY